MTAVFVLGTRPEIIKLYPVISRYVELGLPFRIVHTNQHYSPGLDSVFFRQLRLPPPDVNLGVGSGSQAEQLGLMLTGLETALEELRPDVVYVQGDTNTVLAGALTASRAGIPVAHVEAGLRSYDRRMPEEVNRILADNLSRILLAPTEQAQKILLGEGFPAERVFVTGNTVVDAVSAISGLGEQTGWAGGRWNVERGGYFLVTLHRPENVDDPDVLAGLLRAVDAAAGRARVRAVFPVHPRTQARMDSFHLRPGEHILAVEPVDYVTFVSLQRHARLIVTDSGGVQEEACVLGVPCVTARLATERPETVEAGANVVAGVAPEDVIAAIEKMDGRPAGWRNPFGDGRAGERIVDIVLEELAG